MGTLATIFASLWLMIALITCVFAQTPVPVSPTEVINAGVGGNNTNNVLARLDADVIAHKPDLTLVMIGTNDTLAGHSHSTVPPDVYERNLREIVRRLHKSGSQVILMTVLPCIPDLLLTREDPANFPGGPNSAVARSNDIVRRIAASEHCLVVDTFTLFLRAGNLGPGKDCLLDNVANSGMTDGVHPTPDGCRIIATAVWQRLSDAGLKPRRIACLGDSITAGAFLTGVGTITGDTYPAYLSRLLNGE